MAAPHREDRRLVDDAAASERQVGVQASGGGGITNQINIVNNHPGAKVSTKEEKDEKGGMKLEVLIDSVETAMAQRLQRPGTTLNRALASAANPIRAR